MSKKFQKIISTFFLMLIVLSSSSYIVIGQSDSSDETRILNGTYLINNPPIVIRADGEEDGPDL